MLGDHKPKDGEWNRVGMNTISKWVKASRHDLLFEVAERSLEGRLVAVARYLPLAAKQAEEDVEHVHQLRVWSRRATAALRLYREVIPWSRSGRLKEDLSRVRRAANDARDLDVLLLRLQTDAADPGAARILERVGAQRAAAQQPLLEIFDRLEQGEKFEHRVKKLLKRVRQRGKTDKLRSETFGRWARRNLRPFVEQFLHDGQADLHDLVALHRFRNQRQEAAVHDGVVGRRLSIAVHAPALPESGGPPERLGEINDCATAQTRCQLWLDEAADVSEVDYVKRILAEEQQRLEQRQQEFLAWWRRTEWRGSPRHSIGSSSAVNAAARSHARSPDTVDGARPE